MTRMLKVGAGALICAAAAVGIYAWAIREAPVTVQVVEASRKSLESILETNGKVEPAEIFEVRAELEGTVEKVLAARGDRLRAGQSLARLDTGAALLELEKARAVRNEAQAQLAMLERGGRDIDRVTLENEAARLDRQIAETKRDLESTARLIEKGAATRQERLDLERRLKDLEGQEVGIAARKKSLVTGADLEMARARVAAAESEIRKAGRSLELAEIRTPRAGEVYSMDLKPGAFLRPGDLVARLALSDKARVLVQVDEPELGQIRLGMPARIRWEALPDSEWRGIVGQLPTQIVNVGARQIGEVIVEISQKENALAPGATVNVELEVGKSESTVVVPKEAVQRRGSEDGVYVLGEDNRVAWRAVTVGQSNAREAEIVQGLRENERLAVVAASVRLEDGTRVKAGGGG